MKVTVELEVPEGYEVIGYRHAVLREEYLNKWGQVEPCCCLESTENEYFILKPIAWREEKGGEYWYLSSWCGVVQTLDGSSTFDDELWVQGNYFKTEEAAQAVHKEVLKLYKEHRV